MIPVFRPSIGDEEVKAVAEVLKSGWLGLGPKTADFEKKFSEYLGCRFAVGVNSGTAALHLALNVLGIDKGDEVIVPTITFISTPHAVSYQQATPVFADVYKDTLCIDVSDIERKITSKTKAIVPVHYAGHPCDLEEIRALADEKDIAVVEDAAHACGAEYREQKIGSISNFTCFSFHAVKNLACGEGGMITTDDEESYTILRELYWLGINKTTHKRTVDSKIYAWQYWVNRLGFKAHLNDIAAAIGLVQLRKLDGLNSKRRYIVNRYNEALADLDYIETPQEREYVKSSWHIYHIKLEKRDELIAFLKEKGIAPGVHYYPNHLHPYYKSLKAKCPVSEKVWKEIISLPLYPDMTEEVIDMVIDALKEFDMATRKESIIIRGETVNLKKIESTDLPLMLKWRNKKESRAWFFNQEKITIEAQEEWYNRYLEDKTDSMYVIETKKGVPIGTIGLNNIDEKNRQTELGRMLIGEEKYRAKGYGSDATQTLLKHCFEVMNLNRVYLNVFEHNAKAVSMYRKIGFSQEGVFREAVLSNENRFNITLMGILRNEFEKKK
jgi:perosamine synthetase